MSIYLNWTLYVQMIYLTMIFFPKDDKGIQW